MILDTGIKTLDDLFAIKQDMLEEWKVLREHVNTLVDNMQLVQEERKGELI